MSVIWTTRWPEDPLQLKKYTPTPIDEIINDRWPQDLPGTSWAKSQRRARAWLSFETNFINMRIAFYGFAHAMNKPWPRFGSPYHTKVIDRLFPARNDLYFHTGCGKTRDIEGWRNAAYAAIKSGKPATKVWMEEAGTISEDIFLSIKPLPIINNSTQPKMYAFTPKKKKVRIALLESKCDRLRLVTEQQQKQIDSLADRLGEMIIQRNKAYTERRAEASKRPVSSPDGPEIHPEAQQSALPWKIYAYDCTLRPEDGNVHFANHKHFGNVLAWWGGTEWWFQAEGYDKQQLQQIGDLTWYKIIS